MNRPCRHALLAPLLAVVALLLGLTGSASAAFNHAATEPHYENFLLRESEASGFSTYQIADPTKENGEWIYDGALGVPVYVRQNPWTFFDPWGLEKTKATERGRRDLEKTNSEQYAVYGRMNNTQLNELSDKVKSQKIELSSRDQKTINRLTEITAQEGTDQSQLGNQMSREEFQTTLDVVGMIPVVGEPVDLANGLISLANGDTKNAVLSFGAVVPFLGNAATATKFGNKLVKVEKTVAKGIVYKTTKEATAAAEAMGFKKIKETVHGGEAVFKRGNEFITRDATGHIGGAWKKAFSIKDLGSKKTRAGTFDANLERIGE